MSKEATVIVLDVGSGTAKQLEEGGKAAIKMFLQQKLMFRKSDEVGIVLLGHTETRNVLADEGYEHVFVARDITKPGLEMLHEVDDIAFHGADGDVVDGLVVAMDMLIDHCGKKKYQKRVFLVTEGGNEVDDDGLDRILDRFKDMDAKLTVIGIDFAEIDSDSDSDSDDDGPATTATDPVAAPAPGGRPRSAVKAKNEALLANICREVGGSLVPVTSALQMMSEFRAKGVLQRPTYTGHLEITPDFPISVVGYVRVAEQKFPTLKKISIPGQEAGRDTTVKMDRSYHTQDEEEAEVESDEKVRAYKYGQTLVPFGEHDAGVLKYKCPKSLQVIGFTEAKSVPRHHSMANVISFVSMPGDEIAYTAMAALVHALYEMERVAIVRYVRANNGAPKLGMLSPSIEEDGFKCLHFHTLPFAEDVRSYPFASLSARPKFRPSPTQLTAAEQLIRAYDLMTADEDDYGDAVEAYAPTQTYNPILQYFYQCVQHRAVKPDDPLPPIDPLIQAVLEPHQGVIETAQPILKAFKEVFPLERDTSATEKKKRRFWSDTLDIGEAADAADPAAKRIKMMDDDDGADFSLDSLLAKRVSKVGTQDPVGDFTQMIGRRDEDLVGAAIEQMCARITQLVTDSFRDAYFNKALECLVALREACVREEESANFNAYLLESKGRWGDGRSDFWPLVVSKEVTLISSDEADDSEVSPEEAAGFHAAPVAAPTAAAPAPAKTDDDDEDLFDMIA